jgi:hypothetical protein
MNDYESENFESLNLGVHFLSILPLSYVKSENTSRKSFPEVSSNSAIKIFSYPDDGEGKQLLPEHSKASANLYRVKAKNTVIAKTYLSSRRRKSNYREGN